MFLSEVCPLPNMVCFFDAVQRLSSNLILEIVLIVIQNKQPMFYFATYFDDTARLLRIKPWKSDPVKQPSPFP